MAIPTTGYAYESDAAADGVLAYFPMFDVFETSICRDIVGGLVANVTNDVGDATLINNGIIGYSRNLTANGQGTSHSALVKLADYSNSTVYDSWSFVMWYNPTSLDATRNTYLASILNGADGFALYFNNGNIVFEGTGLVGVVSAAYSPTLATNHMVVVISDASTTGVSIYADNALVLSSGVDKQNLYPYSNTWYIGDNTSEVTSLVYFDGIVDEIALFNRVLTTTDMNTLWNAGAGIELVQYANKHREFPVEIIGRTDTGSVGFVAIAQSVLGIDTDNNSSFSLAAAGDVVEILGETAIHTITLAALPVIDEEVGILGTGSENLAIPYFISEGYGFISGFNIDGDSYIGVVLNSETTSVTEYTNTPFNSIAHSGGRLFASDGEGIVEFGGQDDDGTSIEAYITTKLFSFSRGARKRIERAYIGLRNDTPIVLKVLYRDDSTGSRKEYWYTIDSTSESLREQRVKIGKGINGHYFQFTLSNTKGGDFELDTLEFKPILLSRRV